MKRASPSVVLTGAHAADSLREAGPYRDDFTKRTRCRARANSLMREERAARRMLGQEQRVRLAIEAVADTRRERAGVAGAPLPSAEIRAAPPPQVQAVEAGTLHAPALPAVAQVRPAVAEAAAQAEAFALEEVEAAAQIRHDRGITPRTRAYFHAVAFPADPAVIDALVHGDSAMLTLLDDIGGEDLAEAA